MTAMAAKTTSQYALYWANPLLFEASATVIHKGLLEVKKGVTYHVIELDRTLFHPQGGGQPADKGTINGIAVDHVHKVVKDTIDNFSIYHCFKEEPALNVDDRVELKVEEAPRRLHMKLHSGGHLIADAVNRLFPNLVGKQGNHTPGDTYVKFTCEDGNFPKTEDLIAQANAEIQRIIETNVPAQILEQEGVRKMQIGEGTPVACGGTHLTAMSDLEKLTITGAKPNLKEKMLTVKYTVG